MNRQPLAQIKTSLISMYPGYRFDVIANHITRTYEVDVHKGKENISKLVIDCETPESAFWEKIKKWMKPILMHNR
jgi:hypothetical protein